MLSQSFLNCRIATEHQIMVIFRDFQIAFFVKSWQKQHQLAWPRFANTKKGAFIRKIEIERWDGMEFALFWNEFKITLAMLRIEADNSNVLEIWLLSAILSQTKIATHFLAINPTLRLVSCVLFIGSAGD